MPSSLRVLGLFSGIGGLELGFRWAGHRSALLCEKDPLAASILRREFGLEVAPDIEQLCADRIPPVDVVVAGFPCQDLSQAGLKIGIGGARSGLVEQVFRLLGQLRPTPSWLVLENVPFMLSLARGQAMHWLTGALRELGWRWAYRVVDTRAFGLPQRRRRVLLLASGRYDPGPVLLSDGHGPESPASPKAFGFYWTEGRRGLGWAVESTPPLKAGSRLSIPSPPAIWFPPDRFVVPDLRDAERLQGFPVDWTRVEGATPGARWRLVGNAVSVPVARWLGERLALWPERVSLKGVPWSGSSWPSAAWGDGNRVFAVQCSEWPVSWGYARLSTFLRFPPRPLSRRAALGFRRRARQGSLRFAPLFLDALDRYIDDPSMIDRSLSLG